MAYVNSIRGVNTKTGLYPTTSPVTVTHVYKELMHIMTYSHNSKKERITLQFLEMMGRSMARDYICKRPSRQTPVGCIVIASEFPPIVYSKVDFPRFFPCEMLLLNM